MARVLVACEFSGVVRRAFEKAGHHAWSCDLLSADDCSQFHFNTDAIEVATKPEVYGHWDLMISHPPCTYLSVSGMHWTARGLRDPQLTEDALDFVRRLMSAPIRRIAVENPVSIISSRIRKPDQTIHPWQFGHDASKRTCLWLKNLPPLKPTRLIEPRLVCCGETIPSELGRYGCPFCGGDNKPKERWSNQTNSGQNVLPPSEDRWKKRSVTYEGIAQAMADQWGALL